MSTYEARTIRYLETVTSNDWKIKVYTISKTADFNHPAFYQSVKAALPEWLLMENRFNSNHNKVGFLILHAATEGIFSLINWWVGENMLHSHIFLTSFDSPGTFQKISGDGLMACVWELEIMNHERNSWIRHVLKKMPDPDYARYLEDTVNAIV